MFDNSGMYYGRDPEHERDPEQTPEQKPEQEEDGFGKIVSSGVPVIRVVGVGGAGNNAVNRMIDANIKSAQFIAVNTDAQILLCSKAPVKIQIGVKRTNGLGAGADPAVGREAAEESQDMLARAIEGTDLLFITAGMGGGTGTGAAPVLAKIAREKKILTVAVVTEPFEFEGRRRMDNAVRGIEELRKYVDTLLIVPNGKIKGVVDKTATLTQSFAVADDVLKQGIRGIVDIFNTPALINLDFADVRTVLKDKGLAHMGVGVAKGENRIVEAVRLAVTSPLLETTIEGATSVIVNVVGGQGLTLEEFSTAVGLVQGVVDYNCNIVAGICIDEGMQDEVEITVIATGFPAAKEILENIERISVEPREYRPAQPAQPAQPAPFAQPVQRVEPAPQPVQPVAPARPAQPAETDEETPASEHATPQKYSSFLRRLKRGK